MLKKWILVPAVLIAITLVTYYLRILSIPLGVISTIVYIFLSLTIDLLLRRFFGNNSSKFVFSLSVISLQFVFVMILASASSFSMSTVDNGHYKPAGTVDIRDAFEIALISTGLVAISMGIVDLVGLAMEKLGGAKAR